MVVVTELDVDSATMDMQNLTVKPSKKGKLSNSLSGIIMLSTKRTGQSLSALSSSTSPLSTMTASRASERKFHRYFKQVPMEEHVLVHYRCALVRDMLLQGHLYITPNHFAFYSNVFGYVTRLLIPMRSITEISKQKKVKFITNAVAIITNEEKYVLASLLWKDSAFVRMKQIWEDMRGLKSAAEIPPSGEGQLILYSEDPQDNSEDNHDENDSGILENETGQILRPSTTLTKTADGFSASLLTMRPPAIVKRLQSYFDSSTIVAILLVLLVALFVYAAVMVMIINAIVHIIGFAVLVLALVLGKFMQCIIKTKTKSGTRFARLEKKQDWNGRLLQYLYNVLGIGKD